MLGRQWELRLENWKKNLEKRVIVPFAALETEYFTTFDRLELEEACGRKFKKAEEGMKWGKKWEYAWFRTSFDMPKELSGKRVVLCLRTAPEMLVFVNGKVCSSIDRQHDYITLERKAVPGRHYDIMAECFAGNGLRLEDCGPAAPDEVTVPEDPGLQATVGRSFIGIFEEEIFQTFMDYLSLYELMKNLPEESLRRQKIISGLKRFTYAADFELPYEEMKDSIVRAREELKPLMECKNGSTAPEFAVFGQSHLDLMWMWHEDETIRKSARTYSNQLALMEEYPEFRFLMCCPTVIEYLKKYYPEVYREVMKKVKSGNFIPDGAMWVECDTNIPSGESIIRQFVRGKRWFKNETGTDSRMAWMPDTFGFSGALPQIMKKCGINYFATQKLLRADPEAEQFPYNIFEWEGIDGTRVLSHIYKKNNSRFSPAHLIERWNKDRNQEEDIDTMMFPFGFGDGGGGVTREMLEQVRRCRDLEGAPRCKWSTPYEFFKKIEKEGTENVYTGELYLAWHRGTYTVQAETKRLIRQAEQAVHDLEYFMARAWFEGKMTRGKGAKLFTELKNKTSGLWDVLLFSSFHDIAAGTSIERVHKDVNERLKNVIDDAKALISQILALYPQGEERYLNTTGDVRYVEGLPVEEYGGITADYIAGQGKKPERKKVLSVKETKQGFRITNAYFTCFADRLGRITEFKLSDQSDSSGAYHLHEMSPGFLSTPWNEFLMFSDINGCYDAWEIGSMYEKTPVELEKTASVNIYEEPGKVTVHVERKLHDSLLSQDIIIGAYSKRIDFKTVIDWNERHKLLKVSFPCDVHASEAMEEIQFGYVKRPTHRSTQHDRDRYEVSNRRYTCLTDGGKCVAVLNDGKYGVSVEGSDIRLTLLRAPLAPDMNADKGRHEFTYSVYPFTGTPEMSRLLSEAADINAPLLKTNAELKDSFLNTDMYNIIPESVFIDEETGECVVRLYEAFGVESDAVIGLPKATEKAFETDMLLENRKHIETEDGACNLHFTPFEIKTLVISPEWLKD